MKTTYAPKFPETRNAYDSALSGPLVDYNRLIAAINKKIANGEKLDYHIEKERRIIKPKKDLMCYVSRVYVPELQFNRRRANDQSLNMREEGFYWVRPLNSDPDYWIIAFWFKEGWARIGFENKLCKDSVFDEIDEIQIKRGKS